MGPGRGGVGQRQPGWGGRNTVPLLPPPAAALQTLARGTTGTPRWGSWGALGEGCSVLPRPPPSRQAGFALFFLRSLLLSPKSLFLPPANAAAPGHRLGFLPLPSSPRHGSPFGWQMSPRGFWNPHPVPDGCWPHAGPCPPHRSCCRRHPAATSAPRFGPRGRLSVPPGWAVGLRLPRLTHTGDSVTLSWGWHATSRGTACHHSRDRLAPPRGQHGRTPRDGVTCPWGPRSPWGRGDTPTPYSAARAPPAAGVCGGCCLRGGLGTSPGAGTTRGAGDANGHLELPLPLARGQHSCPRRPPPRAQEPGPLLQWPSAASPRVPPQPRRAQGGAAVPGSAVPGVPGLVLGGGGCPAARLWRCPPGGVCGAGPADRLKVLARARGGGQQAYLPNDYNCLLGADSKLICFLVQGP